MELLKILPILVLFSSVEFLFIVQISNPILHLLALSSLLIFALFLFSFSKKPSPMYLVDFSCFKPPDSCRVPHSTYLEHAREFDFLDQKSIDFIAKVLTHSGQGDQTYLPPAIHCIPPKSGLRDAIEEVHMSLFPVFRDLLTKTRISPGDIDVLIVNCSGFCPAPSLSAIIVNEFSLRQDVRSFNLTGMGCSASALAVDMAKSILKSHKNCNVVILSTEILSTGWYRGKEKNKLVINCIFRMGAAGILLTNRETAKNTAKYKLLHGLRTNRAFDDKGYVIAYREEDSDGLTGVAVSGDLIQVVGETLRANIMALGAKILPLSEQLLYAVSIFRRRYINKSVEIYVPSLKSVIQHFCLPTSGKPMIMEIGKGLKLGERDMEAALMTLHRFGNQSSSSIWYELAYLEGKGRMKKGDKILQLGFGTGAKCTSLVWECVRSVTKDEGQKGPWDDTISEYPIY